MGAAFLGDQPFVLGLVGDVGRDGLEQPVAEPAQLAGSELGGLLDQVRLALEPQVGVEVGGQVLERVDDDVGLGHVDPALGQSSGDDPARLVDRVGEPGRSEHGAVGSRVVSASQAAVDRAPVSTAMSSAAARTRSLRDSIRDDSLVSSMRADCFCSVVMNTGSTPATSSSALPMVSTQASTGCEPVWVSVDMALAKHRPPTVEPSSTGSEPLIHKGSEHRDPIVMFRLRGFETVASATSSTSDGRRVDDRGVESDEEIATGRAALRVGDAQRARTAFESVGWTRWIALTEGMFADHDVMGAWHQQRDAKAMPIYEFTAQLATLELPPPEMQQLLGAISGNQEAMDGFVSVVSGALSPADFFSEENIGRIMAAVPVG